MFKHITLATITASAGLALSTTAIAQSADCRSFEFVPSPDAVTGEPREGALNVLYGVHGRAVDDVWAVGAIDKGLDPRETLALHWDGSSWSIVPTPNPHPTWSDLSDVAAIASDDAWAVGSQDNSNGGPLFLRWDGSSWNDFDTSLDDLIGRLEGIEPVADDDIWAVGRTIGEPLAAHWDGSNWEQVSVPPVSGFRNVLQDISALTSDDIWAVGYHSQGFGDFDPLVAHWDGSQWSSMAAPNPGSPSELHGVAMVASDDVWAVGDWFDVDGATGGRALILHYDGSSWSQVDVPDFPEGQAVLYGVAALAADDIYAAGTIGGTGVTPLPLLMHYNGDTWQRIEAPDSGGQAEWFRAAAAVPDDVSGREVWAVGQYFTGQYTGTLTEHLDGTDCCQVDLDGDGSLTIFDFLEFQNRFDAGDLVADFDGDGELTLFDFLAFQNEFDAGCE